MKSDDSAVKPANAQDSVEIVARREMLRRLGVYSAVTAPVLLGLLHSEKAIAQTGGVEGGGIECSGSTASSGGGLCP